MFTLKYFVKSNNYFVRIRKSSNLISIRYLKKKKIKKELKCLLEIDFKILNRIKAGLNCINITSYQSNSILVYFKMFRFVNNNNKCKYSLIRSY